jgi:hypothetical protein
MREQSKNHPFIVPVLSLRHYCSEPENALDIAGTVCKMKAYLFIDVNKYA